MLKFYKYLYYRLYSWNLKAWGEKDIPHWNALIGISFLMLLNLSILLLLVQYLTGMEILLNDNVPKVESISTWLITLGINYFLFVHRRKYQIISVEFNKENPNKRGKNSYIFWLYVALSFLLPFLIISLLYKN